MHLNPKPILIAVVLYTNIGGTMTPVGGPPNIMITSNSIVAQKVVLRHGMELIESFNVTKTQTDLILACVFASFFFFFLIQ